MAERTTSARTLTRGRHPSRPTVGRKGRPTAGAGLGGPSTPRPVGTRKPARAPRPVGTGATRVSPTAVASKRPAVSRLRTSTAIAILTGTLCVFGLVMVGSASPVISLGLYGSAWTLFVRQALWMAVGIVALVLFARVDYRKWRRWRGPLVVATFVMLIAVLVPGVGVTSGGSSRWIGFGMLRLQPSELMKLALAIFTADLLTRRVDRIDDPRKVVVPVMTVLGIASLLILKQPDMGTALVLCCITFGILFMGGVRMRPIVRIVLAFCCMAVVVGLVDPYRRDRILSFLNPGANRSGSGYQVWQSLIGLGTGHLFGLGLGAGRQKWDILPNAQTDFIFSVVGEELGLIGAVLVLGLFFALAWYGFRAALRAPDRFGSLLAVGITIWVTSQAVINIGAVIGVLPVTGIPLPFISFGGSSLVITMAAVGILLNIASQERSRITPSVPRRRPSRT